MGLTIPGKDGLYIETEPKSHDNYNMMLHGKDKMHNLVIVLLNGGKI